MSLLFPSLGAYDSLGRALQMMPSWDYGNSGTDDLLRRKVMAVYSEYDPGMTSEVDSLLAEYEGKEDRLWLMLEKKYGSLPVAGARRTVEEEVSGDSSLLRGLLSQVPVPDSIIAGGQNSSSHDEAETHKREMTALYEACNPSKVEEIDTLLAKYEGKEAEMWVKLERKYGSEAIEAAKLSAKSDNGSGSFHGVDNFFSDGLAFFGNGATSLIESAQSTSSGAYSVLESAASQVVEFSGSIGAKDAAGADGLPDGKRDSNVHDDDGEIQAAAKEREFPAQLRRSRSQRQTNL